MMSELVPDQFGSYAPNNIEEVIRDISDVINGTKMILYQDIERMSNNLPTPPPRKKITRSRKPKSIKQD